MKRWFITGTDTDAGKTRVACALIRHLVGQGLQVAAMKPVASGSERGPEGLRNADALAMMAAANVDLDYAQVNPFAYEPAIAPHIAAEQAGRPVDFDVITDLAESVRADHLVIEGAGGWCVPLGKNQWFPDLVRALDASVILVVGMKLGCINHATLTARQIMHDGCILSGWIANAFEPRMAEYDNNRKTLEKSLPAPLIGELRWEADLLDMHHDLIV